MREIRAASIALLGLTALACTATASAAPREGVDAIKTSRYALRPMTLEPGGRIAPSVRDCRDNARVSSAVFETAAVRGGRDSATAQVGSYARRGERHEVTIRCGGESLRTYLTIEDRNGNGRDDNGYGGQGRGNGRGESLLGGLGRGNDSGGNGYGGGGRGNDGGYGGGGRDRPDYEQHGVRAGVGGSIGGFDLKKVGLGAALIAVPLGAAWRMSRRRTSDGKS